MAIFKDEYDVDVNKKAAKKMGMRREQKQLMIVRKKSNEIFY